MIDPSQMGAPPAMMQPGMEQQMPPGGMPGPPAGPPPGGGMPPETMDGGAMPQPQIGASTDPGTLAQIAMEAIMTAAGMDAQAFQQAQQAAIAQALPAMQAIIAQLGQPAPETMDAQAGPMPVEEEMPEEMMGGPMPGMVP